MPKGRAASEATIRKILKEIENKKKISSSDKVNNNEHPQQCVDVKVVKVVMPVHDAKRHEVSGTHDFMKCASCKIKGKFNPECKALCSLDKEFHDDGTPKCNISYPHDFKTCPNKLICDNCNRGGHRREECRYRSKNIPENVQCQFCHMYGHTADICPSLIQCQLCHVYGHSADICPTYWNLIYYVHSTHNPEIFAAYSQTNNIGGCSCEDCTPTSEIKDQSHICRCEDCTPTSEIEDQSQICRCEDCTPTDSDTDQQVLTFLADLATLSPSRPPRPAHYTHNPYKVASTQVTQVTQVTPTVDIDVVSI